MVLLPLIKFNHQIIMDIQTEIKTWSDDVLRILVEEEECSHEFRVVALAELDSRPDSQITLTERMIREQGTGGMEFTYAQMETMGVPVPPTRGWLKKLIGKRVSRKTWRKFCSQKKHQSERTLF